MQQHTGLFDPSTKKLDKWRFMFHIFNLGTLTLGIVSFGVSMVTFTSGPPYPVNVQSYAVPMIYYGINSFATTLHGGLGATGCVKSNLGLLKVYTAIGCTLVLEETGFGVWFALTTSSRIDDALREIRLLETKHGSQEGEEGEAKTSNSSVTTESAKGEHTEQEHASDDALDESEAILHGIYSEINEYYYCCMFLVEGRAMSEDFEQIYEHCLTPGNLFCGESFKPDPNKFDYKNCDCEVKVNDVITSRIVRQTALLFLILPAQLFCLICVGFFIKFEITVRNNSFNNYIKKDQSIVSSTADEQVVQTVVKPQF